MPINYDKFFKLLKEKGVSSYHIRKNKLLSQATLQKLRSNDGIIDTRTIEKICTMLDCQPGDIMEHIDDKKDSSE